MVNPLILLARPAGFEPPTSGFVVIRQEVYGFWCCLIIVVTVRKMAFQGTVSFGGIMPCFVLFTIH
jgi:hypothetical protein